MTRTLSSQDTLMISASSCGREILRISLSGVESLAAVMREISRRCSCFNGLLEVALRNTSRGWSVRQNLYLTGTAA